MHLKESLATLLFLVILTSCNKDRVYKDVIYEKPPIVKDPSMNFMSPEESMKTMYLPDGYHLELVASEPMINEPVTMAWGPNGKLYVAEMLTYMQDADGVNQDEPWSRVSILEDFDGDGKMDKSTVFIDSLVLPRILMPLDDRVMVGETYDSNIWSYRDSDGDNVADEKVLLFENNVRNNNNLEHQPSSLTWSIDNWLYLSMNPIRHRFTKGKMETDTLSDAPLGQWGLTQDEIGQLYYSRAGQEKAALGFQQHPYYGTLELKGQWEKDFEKVWPIIGTPDVQGGKKRLREDGTLNHFTACAGQSIFLGDKLPAYGDLFIPEPVGRLIRRAKVYKEEGKTVLRNTYEQTEFLASTDANFRPVETKTGPDGCLYIVDMYRGIVQEGNWVRKGTFLRDVVDRKQLDKNIGKGRIYRVVHDDIQPGKIEQLLDKSSHKLISYLSHPNAWYRMNAQKLIILKNEASVIPDLKDIVNNNEAFLSNNDEGLERLHALWTLEGLEAIDQDLIIEKLRDEDSRVKRAALRISEPFLKKGNNMVFNAVKHLQYDEDKEVLVQLLLSLRSNKDKKAKLIINEVMSKYPENEMIQVVGKESLNEDPPMVDQLKKKHILVRSSIRNRIVKGYSIFNNLCTACHGLDGAGIEGLAPPLIDSPRITGKYETAVKIVLDGLKGPIEGKEYAGVMAGMKAQNDEWIAAVLTYIKMELNNEKVEVRPGQVARIREKVKDRDGYWTIKELETNK